MRISATSLQIRNAHLTFNKVSKALLRVLFLLFILIRGTVAFASHIFGGELLYTHISGNTYKITFTVYGDCSASPGIFNSLSTATPQILIYDGVTSTGSMMLAIEETGTDVSPVCNAKKDSTRCNGGTLPGVRRFKYTDTVTLPYRSANWKFVFGGNMASGATQAGRSGSITNIIPPSAGSSVIQLEADLDNSVSDNSSPEYSSIPTPFYCVHLSQQYNQGAIDADGDSLAYSLVSAIDATTQSNVIYKPPFSSSTPIATDSGTFNFNALNGQVSFIPSVTQDALVVCKVYEYRNGVLIGTSERELTFVVLDQCQGTPPATTLDVISGSSPGGRTASGGNVINVCVNTDHVSFSIDLVNPDNDPTELSANGLPPGASLNITNNNTTAPHAVFDWSTATTPIGVYTFYLTIKNDHCPLANRITVAYTINVTPFPEAKVTLLSPTECLHRAGMQYDLKYGYTPRTVTIKKDSTIYSTYADTTGIIKDSLPAGNYIITCSSNPQCSTSAFFAVSDSGHMPLLPIIRHYCLYGHSDTIDVGPIGPTAVITWYLPNGSLLFYPPVPDTKKAGEEHFYFTEQYAKCMSDAIPVTATIHPLPSPEFADSSKPATICLGDTIYLTSEGNNINTWTPQAEVMKDTGGNPYIVVMKPVRIQLKAADIYGCADSSVFSYKDIQYCCQFSYPNAFTPNGDGQNDGFSIISYGNLTEYDLTIYNRWGQQVFHSSDAGEHWNGTYNGIPCDLGTYIYYFKGKCITGNKAETRGDVILIR